MDVVLLLAVGILMWLKACLASFGTDDQFSDELVGRYEAAEDPPRVELHFQNQDGVTASTVSCSLIFPCQMSWDLTRLWLEKNGPRRLLMTCRKALGRG